MTDRFDGWFGSLMRNRRDWERYLADQAGDDEHGPSEFVAWVADRLIDDDGSSRWGRAPVPTRCPWPERGFEVSASTTRAARSAGAQPRGPSGWRAGVVPAR